jgi:hypothetical protein
MPENSIALPDFPTHTEFEEYVAAYVQAAGLFVERSLIDRQEEELLELDIIATDYVQTAPPRERLIEVKSGDWGFADIFKISGWGKYLGVDQLALVISRSKTSQTFIKAKSSEIGVSLLLHPNDPTNADASELVEGLAVDPCDVSVWRFSHWTERKLLRRLKVLKKSCPDVKAYQVLDDYYHQVTSAVFFSKNIVQRARALYSVYQLYPNLTARVGCEKAGGSFDDDPTEIPKDFFAAAYYRGELNDLAISTFVEQRSRLALLKAAIDLCQYEDFGVKDKVTSEIEILGLKFSLKGTLPSNFLVGVNAIRKEPYFHRYAVFWQVFLWLFGGFILEDYKSADFTLLSLKTGIPVEHVPSALAAYDKLFPTPGGWFRQADANSRITFLKLVPPPMMGVGAHYRRLQYAYSQNLDDLTALTGRYTKADLAKRINCLFALLAAK